MIIDAPSPCHIPALRALWREAFGDSEEFLDMFGRIAFAVDCCRCITVGDTVVAALYWFDCSYRGDRIAYLYAIATAKAYRGHGYCTALMEDTHRHLRELGYEGAILVPGSEALFAFYKRHAYHVCSYIGEFDCHASTDGLAIRQIDIKEYAKLRRELLPEGGVIQENESLSFLQAQAEFFTGDGFLLAARRKSRILYGVELLGDTAKAPAIVRALRCAEGRFRIPGTDIPFAMYRSLGDLKHAPPTYFGLAFD